MRIKALIIRIIHQMFRDKRTLALLFVAPILILTLMHFILNSNTVKPKLGVINVDVHLIDSLQKNDITIITYEHMDEKSIKDEKLDGYLVFTEGKVELTLVNDDPNQAKLLLMKINQTLTKNNSQTDTQISINYLYGSRETTFFDVLSPVLVGYFVFFFVFLISGIGLLRERTTGTLERLLSTPIKRSEIVFGYLIGYGIFALMQTIIVVFYSVYILDITLVGSMFDLILINLVLAIVALSIGIFLSTFAASEFQMMQFIPIVIIPQFFYAGIVPIEGMPHWMQIIGKIMPIYYAANALKSVMYKGWSLLDVKGDVLALIGFALVFITLNMFSLKKYRIL